MIGAKMTHEPFAATISNAESEKRLTMVTFESVAPLSIVDKSPIHLVAIDRESFERGICFSDTGNYICPSSFAFCVNPQTIQKFAKHNLSSPEPRLF